MTSCCLGNYFYLRLTEELWSTTDWLTGDITSLIRFKKKKRVLGIGFRLRYLMVFLVFFSCIFIVVLCSLQTLFEREMQNKQCSEWVLAIFFFLTLWKQSHIRHFSRPFVGSVTAVRCDWFHVRMIMVKTLNYCMQFLHKFMLGGCLI